MYAELICRKSVQGMLYPACISTVPANLEELLINVSDNQCTVFVSKQSPCYSLPA